MHVPAGDKAPSSLRCVRQRRHKAANCDLDYADGSGNPTTLSPGRAPTGRERCAIIFWVATLTAAVYIVGGNFRIFTEGPTARGRLGPTLPGANASPASYSYARRTTKTGQSVSVATGVAPSTRAGRAGPARRRRRHCGRFTQYTDTTNGTWRRTRRGETTTSGVTLNSAYKLVTAGGAQTYDHANHAGTARITAPPCCARKSVVTVTGTPATTERPIQGRRPADDRHRDQRDDGRCGYVHRQRHAHHHGYQCKDRR